MQPVEYTTDNAQKCWCGQCPVQKQSSCAKQEYQAAEPKLQQGEMPPPDQMPGLYCGTGTASCDDLQPVERCLCPECLVWGEHKLLSNHYCVQGSAEEVAH